MRNNILYMLKVITFMNEKEARQVNKKGTRGMANMHKKQRRQIGMAW